MGTPMTTHYFTMTSLHVICFDPLRADRISATAGVNSH